jgi:hypothetical protein
VPEKRVYFEAQILLNFLLCSEEDSTSPVASALRLSVRFSSGYLALQHISEGDLEPRSIPGEASFLGLIAVVCIIFWGVTKAEIMPMLERFRHQPGQQALPCLSAFALEALQWIPGI